MLIGVVRVALKKPYTFVVLALLLLLIGPLAALRMPTDIFPEIRIPVIAVAWQYTGLPPDQMAGRISTLYQRALTTTVNDIEHIEANSYPGVSIVKIFFQRGVDVAVANAQVTAVSQTVVKQMPPGMTPPLILNYNAATVPILQLALSGNGLSEQALFDLGVNTVRPPLVTVPGAAIPYPYGGKQRQVQIDLDNAAMQARGLSGQDVALALGAQNVIVPVGTQKIGAYEYSLQLNNAASVIADIGNLPVKVVNGSTIYIRDIAQVHDGNAPQTSIVHVDGGRSVLMSVLKNGATSTVAIVSGIRAKLDEMRAGWPEALKVVPINDQSLFVRAAINGVAVEALIAALLTSLMILLFLGSWRSTVIIAVSIPLSILGSIIALAACGETLNIMTLGGLALAVGILVDDATVTIENINWHLEQGKDVETAILDGASQIVTPAFVSLLCICIVFVPMFFLEGVARFLFVPMAEAVMFAMVGSFILSRTLVPTMARYLLRPHAPHTDLHGNNSALPPSRNPLVRLQRGFEAAFEHLREGYRGLLRLALQGRWRFVAGFVAVVALSFGLVPMLGSNFFPAVDGGQILIHARVPTGTRVEETAQRFARIAQAIRRVVPGEEITTLVDVLGLPPSSINLTYNNTGVIGSQDGDIQIALRKEHRPTADYVRELREVLPREFPDTVFSFPPADIVSQILNFGAPAPIDLQIRGNDLSANFAYAQKLLKEIRRIPGVADARIQQSNRAPVFGIDVDRTRAQDLGLTARDVTNSLVVSLAGSSQVSPTYWLNPANGVSYPIVMQTPQYKLDTLSALANLPVSGSGSGSNLQVLGGLAQFERRSGNAVLSQYDVQTLVQINATTQDRDLGAVARDIRAVIAATAADVPKGSRVVLLGQVRTMESAFSGLLYGLLGAVVLIYLLIVVNFQSWRDPFVIITALPAALAGIVWTLFATGTTLSVPALTGAIMCMGVATANSVLVVSFARERLDQLGDAVEAALDAGFVRFRPVLMTALAMIIGMLPMALGLGEGGEQNAPLGRAVIGGLLFATVATLVFVPVVFSLAHAHDGRRRVASAGTTAPSEKSMPDELPSPAPAPNRRLLSVLGLLLLLVAIAVLVSGVLSRRSQAARLGERAQSEAVRSVRVVAPQATGAMAALELPGRIEAWSRAPIYARVSGYLKSWQADIGARVKAGQQLAEIETPDLDQQLLQAQAELATARANTALADNTARRWQELLASGMVTRQGADEKAGDLAAKQSVMRAMQANVERFETLKRFTRITAPFDGVVTARNTDVGALINVGGAAGSELFVVSDVRRLRVYVTLPQTLVGSVQAGTAARLTVPERPGKAFAATVQSMSQAISSASGGMLVQLVVDNAESELLPGGFANVSFDLPRSAGALAIPPSALIFDTAGLRVATVGEGDKVLLKPVKVARDLGTAIEIASGLTPQDRVIESPPDGVGNGDAVRVAAP